MAQIAPVLLGAHALEDEQVAGLDGLALVDDPLASLDRDHHGLDPRGGLVAPAPGLGLRREQGRMDHGAGQPDERGGVRRPLLVETGRAGPGHLVAGGGHVPDQGVARDGTLALDLAGQDGALDEAQLAVGGEEVQVLDHLARQAANGQGGEISLGTIREVRLAQGAEVLVADQQLEPGGERASLRPVAADQLRRPGRIGPSRGDQRLLLVAHQLEGRVDAGRRLTGRALVVVVHRPDRGRRLDAPPGGGLGILDVVVLIGANGPRRGLPERVRTGQPGPVRGGQQPARGYRDEGDQGDAQEPAEHVPASGLRDLGGGGWVQGLGHGGAGSHRAGGNATRLDEATGFRLRATGGVTSQADGAPPSTPKLTLTP